MKKTIRKVLSLVLALAFVFSLAACGGGISISGIIVMKC